MLVDSHCHLDFFKNLKPIVKKALLNNVNLMISCSTNTSSIKNHLNIQKEFKEIKICLGIHPGDFLRMGKNEVISGLKLIEKNIDKCSAIGEIGLDNKYAKTTSQKESQEELFRKQIRLSLDADLPVVVHARFAEKKTMEILSEEGAKKVLMHWFTNSLNSVKTATKKGFFMSCGPIIHSSKDALKIAKKIPLKNLLIETDSPVSFQAKQSEPFWVKDVAKKISSEKKMDFEELAEITTKNALNLFNIND